jgi:hypothetical protein
LELYFVRDLELDSTNQCKKSGFLSQYGSDPDTYQDIAIIIIDKILHFLFLFFHTLLSIILSVLKGEVKLFKVYNTSKTKEGPKALERVFKKSQFSSFIAT